MYLSDGIPQQLTEEAKTGKVICQPPSDIFNYPREMKLRKIDLLVAPLIDNEFNRCKSNIKWIETAAIGIPMIGQNICTYNQSTNQVFNTSDDIDEWIDKFFFRKDSKEFTESIILKNIKLIDGGAGQNNGYWLEKNLSHYYNLYSLNQKTISLEV